MEFLTFKAFGYALLVLIPARIIVWLAPESWKTILTTEIWDDPDQ